MNVTSRNTPIQLFSQSLSNKKAKISNGPATTQDKTVVQQQEQHTSAGERFVSDNNIKAAVNQARLLEDKDNTAAATREVSIDESYKDTLFPVGRLGFGNNRGVVAAMSKDSTTEHPEIYLEVWDNGEKRAYLVDVNRIDPAKMTRIEALALAKQMPSRADYRHSTITYDNPDPNGDTVVSGEIGDTAGWWIVIDMVTGFYGKNPTDDFDYYGPESFDEDINYFEIIKSNLSTLSQDVKSAVFSYLDRLESDGERTASDIMKGTLDLLDGLAHAYDKTNPMSQKKGAEKLAGILGKPVAIVYSWLGTGRHRVTPENERGKTEDTENNDSQRLVELFRAAKTTRFEDTKRTDEFNWWNEILANNKKK